VSLQHVARSISGFCDDCEGGRGSREEEDKSEPEQLLSFTEKHAAFKTVKSLFCMHSNGKYYEQKVLNLELGPFHLKHNVATQWLSRTDFSYNMLFSHKY